MRGLLCLLIQDKVVGVTDQRAVVCVKVHFMWNLEKKASYVSRLHVKPGEKKKLESYAACMKVRFMWNPEKEVSYVARVKALCVKQIFFFFFSQ